MKRVLLAACSLSICVVLLAASRDNAEGTGLTYVSGPTNTLATISLPSSVKEPIAIVEEEEEVSEKLALQEEIVQSPVQKPRGRWMEVIVTAYTPFDAIDSHSGYQDGYTSTMVNTQSTDPNKMYGIAADPRAIPYGTAIYVPGYWEALQRNRVSRPTRMTRVDDTGGAMRRNWRRGRIHLDLRFRTSRGARNWLRKNAHRGRVDSAGRFWMQVFVYER